MGASDKRITIFWGCQLDDESIGRSLATHDDQDEAQRDVDIAARLHAFSCERCGSLVDHTLTMSGGEAVCDGCLHAEGVDDGE